jgi:endo-alpha-1,4-polygalactosaminidase (GH114 family)
MPDIVDDNGNEVLRKAARKSGTNSNYSLVMSGGLLEGVLYDDVQIAYPTTTTETYTFYKAAVQQAVLTLTYATAAKKQLTRAQRTA